MRSVQVEKSSIEEVEAVVAVWARAAFEEASAILKINPRLLTNFPNLQIMSEIKMNTYRYSNIHFQQQKSFK